MSETIVMKLHRLKEITAMDAEQVKREIILQLADEINELLTTLREDEDNDSTEEFSFTLDDDSAEPEDEGPAEVVELKSKDKRTSGKGSRLTKPTKIDW